MNKRNLLLFYALRYAYKCITKPGILLIPVFIMVFLTACEDESIEADPQIHLNKSPEFISSDTSITPGTKIKFGITATGDNDVDLTNFLIRLHTDSTVTAFDTGLHAPVLHWQGQFTKGFAEEERWEFIIRDRYGNEDATEIIITAASGSNFGSLVFYDDIVLGAQNNSMGSLFSFVNGNVYTHAEATADVELQKIIDLLYHYANEDKNTIASPGANIDEGIFPGDFQDWQIRNTTRFIKTELSGSDFINAVNDSILVATYVDGAGKRKAKNLKAGDIYAFKTQQEKLGMFMVNEITGTDEGVISIDIKIQEEE